MKKKLISMIIGMVGAITLFGAGAASAAPSKPLSGAGAPAVSTWHEGSTVEAENYWRCTPGYFCAFQHYGGHGWYIEVPPAAVFVNLGAQGLGDQISSITNRTSSSTAGLYDWNGSGQCWVLLWSSGPGNWGDIAHIDNRVDGIGMNGFVDGRVC